MDNKSEHSAPMDATEVNKVVIIGPPGSGKGTQAKRIEQKFGYKHISTGCILRTEKKDADTTKESMRTPEQSEILDCISRGNFVSNETMWKLLSKALENLDRFVLDGFPRNISQIPKVCADLVIFISLHSEECVRRICARCDGRPDDNEEVARHRIETYMNETLPVVEYYKKQGILATIDGDRDIDSVTESIFSILQR